MSDTVIKKNPISPITNMVFVSGQVSVQNGIGLTEQTVREISAMKKSRFDVGISVEGAQSFFKAK